MTLLSHKLLFAKIMQFKLVLLLLALISLVICSPAKKDKESKKEKEPENAQCLLPKVTGRCKAAKRRFYFNKKTSKCEQFTYGGCGGNANNFGTMADCQKHCSTGKPEPEAQCLKITQNVAFEFLNFGILYQFLNFGILYQFLTY